MLLVFDFEVLGEPSCLLACPRRWLHGLRRRLEGGIGSGGRPGIELWDRSGKISRVAAGEHRCAIDFNPVTYAIDEFLERQLPFYYFELEQATIAGSDRLRGFAR